MSDERTSRTRTRWRPSAAQATVLVGAVVGSAFGLLFGLMALNRPLLNALAFYVLGALVGAAAGGAVALARGDVGHRRG